VKKIFKAGAGQYQLKKIEAIEYKTLYPKTKVYITTFKKGTTQTNHKYELVESKIKTQKYSIKRIY